MQKSMENNSAAEHYFCFTKTTPAPAARLFCFHCAGGSPYAYAPWTKYISDQMEVYPFQMAGRCGRIQEPYSRSLETAAQEAAAVIQSYADQKILFTGHSMGGVVAYHTAYLLQTQYGISVDQLFLTASAPDMSHTLRTLYADSIHAEDAAFCDMLLQFGAIDRKVLKVSNFQEQFLPMIRSDFLLLEQYQADCKQKIDSAITVYYGDQDRLVQEDSCQKWTAFTTGAVHINRCSGNHFFIKQHMQEICEAINTCI